MNIFTFSFNLLFFIFLCNKVNSEEISISLNDIGTDISKENYQIKSKVLTLNSNVDYKISGSCNECQISVKKSTKTKITLNSIYIDNSITGPFIIGNSAEVNLVLTGESNILDKEDINNENSDDFEGAGIKFKSSSSLTISGSGKLTVVGNPKNGIKGASESSLTINSGTLIISAAKNALACDNLITINGGTINIASEGDGIKSEPDSDDNTSKGTIIINGGNINIDSESDAIQAAYKLEINGGLFYIVTYEGANSKTFNKTEMSAKGLKCSTNEHENVTNELIINGGEFHLNTSDDAVHSDYNATITKGKFEIISGDDAVHADQYLVLGEKEQTDDSLLNITILKSYEGLEGAQVYIYSGTYYVLSSDDGINSAGDDENCQNEGNMGPIDNEGGMGQIDNKNKSFEPRGNEGGMGQEGIPGSNNNGEMGPGSDNNGGMRPGTNNNISVGENNGMKPGVGENNGDMGQGRNNNNDSFIPGDNNGGMEPRGNNNSFGPGGGNNGGMGNMNSQCFKYHIYIYGGNIYVNTDSDGLDANGNIYISGGNLEVWGMKPPGDGDPIDKDGTLYITGGTVLAGGGQGMGPIHNSASTISQNFIYTTSSFNSNKEISIKSGDSTIKTIITPKAINYLFYSSKDTNTTYKFSEGSTTYGAANSPTQVNQGQTTSKSSNNCKFLINKYIWYKIGFILFTCI